MSNISRAEFNCGYMPAVQRYTQLVRFYSDALGVDRVLSIKCLTKQVNYDKLKKIAKDFELWIILRDLYIITNLKKAG